MPNEPKVIFDPKLNFELPREIGPLLEQTVSVSVAEGFDACFELSLATQNTVASFEKQFAVAQADAKEMVEKLRTQPSDMPSSLRKQVPFLITLRFKSDSSKRKRRFS